MRCDVGVTLYIVENILVCTKDALWLLSPSALHCVASYIYMYMYVSAGGGRRLGIGRRSCHPYLSLALLYTSFLPLLASAAAVWDWLLAGKASCPFGDSLFPLMPLTVLAVLPSALPISLGLLAIAAAPVPSGLPFDTMPASLCSLSLAAGGVGVSWGCPAVVVGLVGWVVLLRMT